MTKAGDRLIAAAEEALAEFRQSGGKSLEDLAAELRFSARSPEEEQAQRESWVRAMTRTGCPHLD